MVDFYAGSRHVGLLILCLSINMQAIPDANALEAKVNSPQPPTATKISDTAAHISSALDALAADRNLASITLTDGGAPTLHLTAAQIANDAAALRAIANGYYLIEITDSGANVNANLGAIAENGRVHSITLTDASPPTFKLNAAQASAGATALPKIANRAYKVAIADTAANIAAHFEAFQGLPLASITVTDGGTPSFDMNAARAANARSLSMMINCGYVIRIADSAAMLLAYAPELAENKQIANVKVVDKAANLIAQASALEASSLVNSVEIHDTLANVVANAGALTKLPFKVSIVVDDSAHNIVDMTPAQVAALETLPSYRIVISDTPANVQSHLTQIASNSRVAAINIQYAGPSTLNLKVAQILSSKALALIVNDAYEIRVIDSVADIFAHRAQLAATRHFAGATAVDSAANLIANASALAADSLVKSIEAQDTLANLLVNAGTLATLPVKLSGISVTDTAANLAAMKQEHSKKIRALGENVSVDVLDTAANIAALTPDQLQDLTLNSYFGKVTLTDSGTPTLKLSAKQVSDTVVLLNAITNASYRVEVKDSAANVSANFDWLRSTRNLAVITLTDSGDPTLLLSVLQATAAFRSVSPAIANSAYNIEIVDSVANILTDYNAKALAANPHVVGAKVVDEVANILAQASALGADRLVKSVEISDTIAHVLANPHVFAKLHVPATIRIVDRLANISALTEFQARALAAARVEHIESLDGYAHLTAAQVLRLDRHGLKIPGGLGVMDTSANIAANIDALNVDANFSSVTITDKWWAATLDLTASQARNDTAVLSRITNRNVKIRVIDERRRWPFPWSPIIIDKYIDVVPNRG